MKKVFFGIIIFSMLMTGCAGGAKPAESSGGMDLDASIREAAAEMGEKLPGGTKIALVSMASSSAQFSEYVIGRLEAALVSGGKLVVVDRANLDRIREEQGFQLSGEVDDDSAKSIGRLLGAGAIVTGSFTDLGDMYSLILKAINIETAAVAVSYPADIARSRRIETLLASGGGSGGAGTGTRTAQAGRNTSPAAPAAPVQTYKIGDTGPAGGIVFFDKWNNQGGWRYMEAAPVSTEQSLTWGAYGTVVRDTSTTIGAGKSNTEAIVKFLNGRGEYGNAAQYCDSLEYGGYDDWFLPSMDELSQMSTNLKQKGLGDFGNDYYWSSSDCHDRYAWSRRLRDGDQGGIYGYDQGGKTKSHPVRAIRQF